MSTLAGKPGQYIWDETLNQFVGRITKRELREDRRFSAKGASSFMNGIIRTANASPKDPQRFQERFTDESSTDYLLKGFSLILGCFRLNPDQWAVLAAEKLGIEATGLQELLEGISKYPKVERESKLTAIQRLYKAELTSRDINLLAQLTEEEKSLEDWRKAQKSPVTKSLGSLNALRPTSIWPIPQEYEWCNYVFHVPSRVMDQMRKWLEKRHNTKEVVKEFLESNPSDDEVLDRITEWKYGHYVTDWYPKFVKYYHENKEEGGKSLALSLGQMSAVPPVSMPTERWMIPIFHEYKKSRYNPDYTREKGRTYKRILGSPELMGDLEWAESHVYDGPSSLSVRVFLWMWHRDTSFSTEYPPCSPLADLRTLEYDDRHNRYMVRRSDIQYGYSSSYITFYPISWNEFCSKYGEYFDEDPRLLRQ